MTPGHAHGTVQRTLTARSGHAFLRVRTAHRRADLVHLERLCPHTLRAYRYELAAAAADPRFQRPLSALDHQDLEAWLVRDKAATSTVGRRIATFRHLFAWAIHRGLCTRSPLAALAPLRGRRTLPRPIREQHEQRALDEFATL